MSPTGLSPSTADHSRPLHLACDFFTHPQHGSTEKMNPTTPHRQPLPGITSAWFSLFRFRSPLLTESLLFSLPVGTEMFHFPTFPLPALYIQAGVSRSYHYADRGFPIRTPSDQNLLISSPRLIADCYVLLRLQMPRHSPFALKDLKSHEFYQESVWIFRSNSKLTNDL